MRRVCSLDSLCTLICSVSLLVVQSRVLAVSLSRFALFIYSLQRVFLEDALFTHCVVVGP